MSDNTIYLVTTNKRKFEEHSDALKGHGLKLVQLSEELVELQTADNAAIIRYKLGQAKKLLPGKKVLVDDRGFHIHALHGFPGPMLKFSLQTFGVEGFLALLAGKTDRSADFITSLGYYDGMKDVFFQAREEGFLLTQPRGNNLRGWTELMYIYGHKSLPSKSLAEYMDEEWSAYLSELSDSSDVSKQFLQHIA